MAIDAQRTLSHIRRVTVVRVRRAVARDLAVLRRIFRRASLSNAGDREILLAHPEALNLADGGVAAGRTRVAVASDGTIVGFLTAVPLDGGALELADLFVDPDWMRRGVARCLMTNLITTARLDGIARIEVTANPHADGFYRAAGFIACHERPTPLGAGTRMQLTIPPSDGRSGGSQRADQDPGVTSQLRAEHESKEGERQPGP
jgi:N-acetylglutamate synthase-like GNAT family acetyltransferase